MAALESETFSRYLPCFRGSHFKEMLDFMAALKNGNVNGIKVILGRLQVIHTVYVRVCYCQVRMEITLLFTTRRRLCYLI